jgi:hypothetical protein
VLHQIWKCLHWPFCPGVFIAVLAFATAAVAFRIDKARKAEKGIWVFIFLMLVVGEIWMMGIDRASHDDEQAKARAEQLRQFSEIAEGLKANIAFEKEHFDSTLSKMNGLVKTTDNELAQITGNGEYCYLMPTSIPDANHRYSLLVLTSGTLPQEICDVNIQKTDALEPDGSRLMFDRHLGPLSPSKSPGKLGATGFKTDISVPEGTYFVFIYTRNAEFLEGMTIRDVNGATSITLSVSDRNRKVLYSEGLPYTGK